MWKGIFVSLIRAIFCFVLFCVLGCNAQAPGGKVTDETARRIESQVRYFIESHNERPLPPSVRVDVGELKTSDIAGFDLVPVTLSNNKQTQTLEFLISKDRKTLMRFEKFDVGTDPESKMDLKGRPIRGNKDAKVTIINYDDFQCPFCSRMHEILNKEILTIYGNKVRLIYKDYPLSTIHPWAIHAAINANCLNDQSGDAYWSFADTIHAGQATVNFYPDQKDKRRPMAEQLQILDKMTTEEGAKFKLDAAKLDACIKAQDDKNVRASMHEGDSFGIESTPTIFVNGERFSGAYPIELVRPILDRALRSVGVEPPPPEEVKPIVPKDTKPAATPDAKPGATTPAPAAAKPPAKPTAPSH